MVRHVWVQPSAGESSTPRWGGGWIVKRGKKASTSHSTHSNKEPAVRSGRQLARREDAILTVQRTDGTIEERIDYAT